MSKHTCECGVVYNDPNLAAACASHNHWKPGATGNFPRGKLTKDDEGELVVGIRSDGHHIVIQFGTPVQWFAVPYEEAIDLALNILRRIPAIEKIQITLQSGLVLTKRKDQQDVEKSQG